MPFSPILDVKSLPAVGARREDLNCDFKGSIDGEPQAELAKDVAAFANASGGTLLIGAQEAPGGLLGGWLPMSNSDADAARREFENAVRDRCSPAPLINVQVFEAEPGKFCVAVNVWPYPLLPVSVRVRSQETGTNPKKVRNWPAWVVFVRVGTNNQPFTPEQAAMLTIPAVRTSLTLLDSIPSSRRNNVQFHFRMPQMSRENERRKLASLELTEIRPLENVIVLTAKGDSQNLGAGVVHVPLSEIEAVWSESTGVWAIKVRGQFFRGKDGAPGYVPNE